MPSSPLLSSRTTCLLTQDLCMNIEEEEEETPFCYKSGHTIAT
jgi:hypothetical protein